MENNINESIIKTLSYSDIFDYPLTSPEIFNHYIGDATIKEKIFLALEMLVSKRQISSKNGFYFLNGRGKICEFRERREKISATKWIIASKIAKILGRLPTVKLIGISGSLSMNNSDIRDDIDLFIITRSDALWITRFVVNTLLLLLGNKRSRLDSIGAGSICPNMFLSESFLKIDENIFAAHEIAQLKVIVNKDNTYEKFISENKWVLKFLPHTPVNNLSFEKAYSWNLKILDLLFYKMQYYYMRKRITQEKIGKNHARFHPKDKTRFVIELYEAKHTAYLSYLSGLKKELKLEDLQIH